MRLGRDWRRAAGLRRVHERRSRHASWERMAVGLVMVVMVVVVRRRRLRMLLHERYGLWDDGQRCQLPLRGAF